MNQTRVEIANDTMFTAVSEILSEGHEVVIMTKGFSMRPFIEGLRDSVVLKRKDRYEPGDIVLAYTDRNIWVLHRLLKTGESSSVLKGDGNLDSTETCSNDKIYGYAITILRPNRKIDCTTKLFATLSLMWRRTPRFPRRVILALYRRLAKKR